VTDFHWDEAKKKFKMADSKKLSFSKSPILKISWIDPWVSRIDSIDAKGIYVAQPIWL
jgi:hypothetical protein